MRQSSFLLIAAIILSILPSRIQAQVAVIPSPQVPFVSLLQNGTVNAFGCVQTVITGTSTPLTTYTDSTGTVANQNPVILSANGTGQIWIQAGLSYQFNIKSFGGVNCASGSTVATVRGIAGGTSQASTTVTYSSTPQFIVTSQNQLFKITLTGNAAALPLSFSGVQAPVVITFEITQDNIGSHTFTWPVNVTGGATVSSVPNSTSTQQFIWDGSTTTAIGPAVTGAGPAITAGLITGTGEAIVLANEGVTGTTLNKLAKLTGSPSTVIVTSTADTNGAIGLVVVNAATTGNAVIQQLGTASCVFDNATTANDYVAISSVTAGDCHDAGAPVPISGQIIGRVLSTNGSPGTYLINLFPPLPSLSSSSQLVMAEQTPPLTATNGVETLIASNTDHMVHVFTSAQASSQESRIPITSTGFNVFNATTVFSGLFGANGFPVGISSPAYHLHCDITYQSSAGTAGPKFQLQANGATFDVAFLTVRGATNTTAFTNSTVSGAGTPNTILGTPAVTATDLSAQVDAFFHANTGGVNSNVNLQFASNGAGTVTFDAYSCTMY